MPQYRYLLAADDELDDGCERAADWEDDAERERLDHTYTELEAADEACADPRFVTSEAERR